MSWPLVQLKEIASVKGGKRLPKGETYSDIPTEYPYLRVCDFKNRGIDSDELQYLTSETYEKISRYVISKDDVYISIAGTIGLVGCIPDSLDGANLTENAAKIVINKPDLIDRDYLIWFLATAGQATIESKKKATSQPKLALFRIDELEIPLPPLPEQKRIAAILDKADQLRQKRQQAIGLADEFLRSVFLDMFGDPVTNPKGWETKPLIDLIDPQRPITYGILKPGDDIEGGVPYIRVVDMQDGVVLSNQVRRATPEIAEQYKRSKLITGDVLMSIRGHVGRLAVVPPEMEGANITQDTARLAVNELCRPLFIYACLQTNRMQLEMQRYVKGAAVKGINLADVKQLKVPVPSIEMQKKIENKILLTTSILKKNEASVELLDDGFNSLSRKAFAGEL